MADQQPFVLPPPPVDPIVIPPPPADPVLAFAYVLEHIIGLDTPQKRNAVVILGGVTRATDLRLVDTESLLDALTANTSVMSKTKLRALQRWVQDTFDAHGAVDVRDFTADVCRAYQIKIVQHGSKTTTSSSDKSTTTKETLPKFNGKRENWNKSKRELTAYLNLIKNEEGVPLYYVIRDPELEQQYRDDNGVIGNKIYNAPFTGPVYTNDAFQVLQILRSWTSGGTAETFVDNTNNVQDAWSQLMHNYEGDDARNANIQRARQTIRNTHWSRNTHNYTFDDYCNKFIKANNELDRYNANVDGESQVQSWLANIKADAKINPHLLAIKAIIRNDTESKSDLRKAVIKFKDNLRSNAIDNPDYRENRHIGATFNRGGRGGRGGGRNDSRGGRGGRGGEKGQNGNNGHSNNLHIPKKILNNLSPKFRAMMYKGRDVMESENNTKQNQNKDDNDNRSIKKIEILDEDDNTTTVTSNQSKNNKRDDDDNGGASSQFGYSGSKKQRTINAIVSTIRRIGKAAFQVHTPTDYDKRARAEIDTRADTVCAGSTFLLYESTGKVVDVSGFHDSYDAIKNIQVGTCITAIDLDGETIIASFPQSLYFGDTMENSLIPPAQLWHYGITVDVVPKQYSDGKSLFGIHHPDDNIFIPFHLHGCISYFSTRLPTESEINNCRWITFTSDDDWYPYSDEFIEAERAMVNRNRYPDPTHPHYDQNGKLLDGRSIHSVTTIDTTIDPSLCTFDYSYERMIHATSSTEHRSTVPPNVLAKRWGTSLTIAEQTVKTTWQRGLRYLQGPLTRRFRTRQKQLERRYLNTRLYTDTFFKDKASARNNTCFQLFVSAEGFVAGEPLTTKADAWQALNNLCRNYGVPRLLISDNAKEETLGDWRRVIKHHLIKQRMTEPHSGWQNRCEDEIREVRKHYARIMALHRCPEAFWDFCMEYVIAVRQFLVRRAAGDRPPLETITGETPDTSEFMDFDFYQWIKYRDSTMDKDSPIKLGRWLGVAHDVGTPLTYWVLKDNGQVIARSTVRPLLDDEIGDEVERTQRDEFDKMVKEKYGDYDPTTITVFDNDELCEYTGNNENGDNGDNEIGDVNAQGVGDAHTTTKTGDIDNGDKNNRDHVKRNDSIHGPDPFKGAEIYLPHGDRNEIAKVIGRKRDRDGNFIGRAHHNQRLDSRIFVVRFPDGDEKDVSYNVLAQHLFSQVDAEGNQYRLFREIIGHRKGKSALDKADQYRIGSDGRRTMKNTTTGWDFEVEWKDGSTSWLPLKEMKETNPVDVAQYARDNRLLEEPAFAWWAPMVLKKIHRLIKVQKSRQVRKGYKFGIRIPTSVEEALALDKENGNTLWYDAIVKEVGNVRIAFEILDENKKPPPGYKKVLLMMIFDIKMDFTRKARLVARGDLTDPPSTLTYSSVVSRESVRIAFLVASMNGLEIMMFDVGNAYLNAFTSEKLYCIAGKEFGDEEGRLMIIRRALYGLKSSGAAYRAHFAQTLSDLGFKSCQADPDVWMRPATNDKGFDYYEYILTYVDDCLVVSHNPKRIIDSLQNEYKYRLKDIGEPTRYLGAQIERHTLNGQCHAWSMSASLYLKQAIIEIERLWGNLSSLFPRQTLDTPMLAGSHPELDDSKFLNDDETHLYQSYIGILRWAVELGRVDLAHSAGVMARFSAAPREGHMVDVMRIFAYCKKHPDSKLVFDPLVKDFDDVEWVQHDWKQFYPDINGEVLPSWQPKALGHEVQINIFCDAAHATCHTTRRSTTGIIIFINGAPISWYSKRQNTIETSTFGSEFVALRIAVEMNEGLRYKLRMMGIPIMGPSNCFCDNQSVVTNSILPHSTLAKKHNSVAYHKVRESVAMDAVRIAHEKGKFNLSDCLTKFLAGPPFKRCVMCILWRH